MHSAADWIASGKRLRVGVGVSAREIFYRREGREGAPVVVMLHGFPTWSYDYASLVPLLVGDYDVIVLDFLGYGASDKPRDHVFTVPESADIVESLLRALEIPRAHLVIHDYGGIVGQELLDRRRLGKLSFEVPSVHLMNCGVVYSLYRPTRMQKLLLKPVLGRLLASRIKKERFRAGLDAVRGKTHRLTDEEFEPLWAGISRERGHTLAYRHITYNRERSVHAQRWLDALVAYDGPLQLIWGLADPVSGKHVLDALRPLVPRARVDALEGVGHFPMSESPTAVATALRDALRAASV